jgi:hypothetical protein
MSKRLLSLALLVLIGSATAQSPALAGDAATDKTIAAIGKDGGYQSLGFNRLANFEFTPPADDMSPSAKSLTETNGQIPAEIKKLDTAKVTISGFMLPVKMENGFVREFLLMKDQSACCYGVVPNMNEWVVVKMNKDGIKPYQDSVVFVSGTLKVGAIVDNGYLAGIYQLSADKMEF